MSIFKKNIALGLCLTLSIILGASLVQAQSTTNTSEEFTVHEAKGPHSFTLSGAQGKYVALHFILKTICPLCMRYTHEYATREMEIPGVYHVFLKPDSDEEIEKWTGMLDEKFPLDGTENSWKAPIIFRDPDAKLAKAFDIPFGYEFHNQVVHYPALVILGPDGTEVFRFVGKSNRERFTFDQFAKKIKELEKKQD